MTIGLIDVDGGHNFPNLALMKLSAWHKARGDVAEWWWGFGEYDRVYMSKVFDETYSSDILEPLNAREIVKGGTGYGLDNRLSDEVEHTYPDYSLYLELTKETAYGFLTRGCPRACDFCIVAEKDGRLVVLPPNDPLTLEELREMGGEPYWHVGLQDDSPPAHWSILDPYFAKHIEDYGYKKRWLAYRRRPEVRTV